MWDGISDDPEAREVAQALIREPAVLPFLVELRQRDAHLDDDALIAAAFDDPAIVTVLIEPSRTNELAMQAVRWALAYHVHRWHRLMHGGTWPHIGPADHVGA
jgi:hypothetical protein